MRIFTIAILVLGLTACSSSTKTAERTKKEPIKSTQQWVDEGYVAALIKDFSSLDGCGFLIITESDKKELMPVDLPESSRKDNVQVWVKYHPIKPIQSTCMKGIPVSVDDIQSR
ncbi:MAG: hypothetical protein JKY42_06640 [Flavobacteriales bacterium]|nr:hypothetical protein [Flavobacteriales bacterium]